MSSKTIKCSNEDCNNNTSFTEETLSIFFADGGGNRENRVNEATKYICNECGNDAIVEEEYDVKVIETLSRVVRVKATSPDDAMFKIKQAYDQEKIVLDSEDFSGLDFTLQGIASSNVKPDQILDVNDDDKPYEDLEE